MKLYLMQHAKPLSKEVDPAQPLSPEGIRDVERMSAWLARTGFRPQVIFHSPKERAKQTAQSVAEKLGHAGRLEVREELKAMAEPARIQKEIGAGFEEVMLVGHLPHLGRLATRLLTDGAREEPSIVAFRQGGVLCLVREEEKWKVAWMVTPDLLA